MVDIFPGPPAATIFGYAARAQEEAPPTDVEDGLLTTIIGTLSILLPRLYLKLELILQDFFGRGALDPLTQ